MWNKIYFLQKAKQVYGKNINKFDFSNIKDIDIINSKSKIKIICKHCNNQWTPQIYDFLNRGKGCPSYRCRGKIKWTWNIFLEKAKEIHGEKYDYSNNRFENINNRTRINIICKKCKHRWSPVLYSHINYKSNCPNCTNRIKCNLLRFLEKAKEIYGDKFDYSQIKELDINNCYSKINIICNKYKHEWKPTINDHIYNKSECPECYKLERYWTLERFLENAKKIHGKLYDYSNITTQDIKGIYSKLKIKCNNEWTTRLTSHIHTQTGFPNCYKSKLENMALNCLKEISIENNQSQYIPL